MRSRPRPEVVLHDFAHVVDRQIALDGDANHRVELLGIGGVITGFLGFIGEIAHTAELGVDVDNSRVLVNAPFEFQRDLRLALFGFRSNLAKVLNVASRCSWRSVISDSTSIAAAPG